MIKDQCLHFIILFFDKGFVEYQWLDTGSFSEKNIFLKYGLVRYGLLKIKIVDFFRINMIICEISKSIKRGNYEKTEF